MSPCVQNAKTNPPGPDGLEPSLTDRQHAAVRLLLRGLSVRKIAAQLGVDRHTITRWKRLPAFQAELCYGRKRVHEIAIRDAAGISQPKPPRPAATVAPPRRSQPIPFDPEFEELMREMKEKFPV